MFRAVVLGVIFSGVKQVNAFGIPMEMLDYADATFGGYTYIYGDSGLSPAVTYGYNSPYDNFLGAYFYSFGYYLNVDYGDGASGTVPAAFSINDISTFFYDYQYYDVKVTVPQWDTVDLSSWDNTPYYGFAADVELDDFIGFMVVAWNYSPSSTTWEEYVNVPEGWNAELINDLTYYGGEYQIFGLTTGPTYEPACKDWCSVSHCPGPNTPDWALENCNACPICSESEANQICEQWCSPSTCYPSDHALNKKCAGCTFCAACADKQDEKKEKKCKKIAQQGKCSRRNAASKCEFTCCNA